MEYADSGDLY
jgi:NIMA (never in mitosis gene a)-related kinase 1/4/5